MELNRFVPQVTTTGAALDEPHFDQEATILSARPVVPLEELQAESGTGKRLVLASAVLVALLIGAFGATLIYKLRRPEPVTNVSDPANAIPPSAPSIEGGVEAMISAPLEIPTKEEPAAGIENSGATRPIVVSEGQRRAAPKKITSGRQVEPRQEAIADYEPNREMRRAEKREARRLRRAERQARHRDGERSGRNPDNLFRIREIFEGSPRP